MDRVFAGHVAARDDARPVIGVARVPVMASASFALETANFRQVRKPASTIMYSKP
jgi:hypothetical protein